VPLVPVVPPPASLAVARSTQPVIFTCLLVSDDRVDCELGVVVCAASPTAKPAATNVAMTIDRFISTSYILRRRFARKLCAARGTRHVGA
jgi:hypothetical protein